MSLLFAAAAQAQTATLLGMVFRDTLGHELGAAEVLLPDLNRAATANYLGEFKFDKLPPGRHAIIIRHIGFSPLFDTVDVADGKRFQREFVLTEQATTLETVRVSAPERKHLSPALQEFEERRKAGFGYFIAEDELRKNDDRPLINVIVGNIPALSLFQSSSKGTIPVEYVSSGRKCGAGPAILGCLGGVGKCPPTLYVDGVLTFDAMHGQEIPNLSRTSPREYAAIEFYAGGATTPARYNATASGCGVLLLWTRER